MAPIDSRSWMISLLLRSVALFTTVIAIILFGVGFSIGMGLWIILVRSPISLSCKENNQADWLHFSTPSLPSGPWSNSSCSSASASRIPASTSASILSRVWSLVSWVLSAVQSFWTSGSTIPISQLWGLVWFWVWLQRKSYALISYIFCLADIDNQIVSRISSCLSGHVSTHTDGVMQLARWTGRRTRWTMFEWTFRTPGHEYN